MGFICFLWVVVGFLLGFLAWDGSGYWVPQYAPFLTASVFTLLVVLFIHLVLSLQCVALVYNSWLFLWGVLLAMPFYAQGLSWFDIPLREEHMPFPYMIIVFLNLCLSLLVGATFWVGGKLRSYPVGQVLGVGLFWMVGEVLRAELFCTPYLTLSHAFMTMGCGIRGMMALGVLPFTGIAVMVFMVHLQWIRSRDLLRTRAVLSIWLCVALMIFIPNSTMPRNLPFQVRLVQTNLTTESKWNLDHFEENFNHLLTLSRANQSQDLKLIIWPETAVTYTLCNDAPLRRRIANIIPKGGYLITGVPHVEQGHEGKKVYRNRLIVLDDQGHVLDFYDKMRLLPFAEYTPFPFSLWAVDRTHDYSPGAGFKYLSLPHIADFIPMICFDASLSYLLKNQKENANFILNISNDIFLGARGAHLHFTHAILTAIQSGLPLIRVSNGGVSGLVGPDGVTIKHLPFNIEGVVDFYLPGRSNNKSS